MKIDLVKIHFKDKNFGEISTYKYLPFEYCCEKLKNFEHVVFDDEIDSINPNDGEDENGDVIPRFFFYCEEPQPWEEDTWPTYYKIDYCPFCGEKINVNVVNNIDKSELCTKLQNYFDALKDAAEETDSVKTKKRIEEEMVDIRRKINNMWEFGEYHEHNW